MNSFNHSEEDAIKKMLEETAQQIEPDRAFAAKLKQQIKQTHISKVGFSMPNLKTITSTLGWVFALVTLAIVFNWIVRQLAPENVPAFSPTEVTTTIENTPSPTATHAPLVTLDPTSASLFFRDDFNGSMDEDWEWIREESGRWSLTDPPGWLEIMAGFGTINGGNMSNLLLRPIPEGNFELETRLNFKPQEEQQIAGLLVYENAANHIQFVRGLCIAPRCVDNELYFDIMTGGSFASENFATKAASQENIYLRVRFEGNTITAYASENGKEWRLIGTHDVEFEPLSVGIFAGQAFSRSALTPAQFDYFIINILP